MHDDGLKRGIHFVCGFACGAPFSGLLGARLYMLFWEFRREPGDHDYGEVLLRAGLVCGLLGGLVFGLLAMKHLDRFWERFTGR